MKTSHKSPSGQLTDLPGYTNIPPAYWNEKELRRLGVKDYEKVPLTDLAGVPHKIFDRERWRTVNQSRFDAMQQSILLASYLLETGLPYLTSFLPKPTFANDSRGRKFIQFDNAPSQRQVQAARDELEEIMVGLEWAEDGGMLRERGWFGLTSQEYPRPDKPVDNPDSLEQWDSQCRKDLFDRRQNTIFIAREYVDALLTKKRNTQEHIVAAFHLALTLVHEIGHLVYWQDFDNKAEPDQGFVEPWVGGQSRRGLGLAFTSWIFGGWNPHPIYLSRRARGSFNSGMCWSNQLASYDGSAFDLLDRPSWEIQYSMPFKHLQNIMSQKTWDGNSAEADKVDATWSFLSPDVPFRNGRHARLAICKKVRVQQQWVWRRKLSPAFRFRSSAKDNGGEKSSGTEISNELSAPLFHDPYWSDEPLSPELIAIEGGSEAKSEWMRSGEEAGDEFSDEYTDEYEDETEDKTEDKTEDGIERAESVGVTRVNNKGFNTDTSSKRLKIKVTFSGRYTKTLEPQIERKRPASVNYQDSGRKFLRLVEFMEYPERTLRIFCYVQGLSSNGSKEAVAQRLEDWDKERHPPENPMGLCGPVTGKPHSLIQRVTISRKSTGTLLYTHLSKQFNIPVEQLHVILDGGKDGEVLAHDDVLISLDPQALSNIHVYVNRPEAEAVSTAHLGD